MVDSKHAICCHLKAKCSFTSFFEEASKFYEKQLLNCISFFSAYIKKEDDYSTACRWEEHIYVCELPNIGCQQWYNNKYICQ